MAIWIDNVVKKGFHRENLHPVLTNQSTSLPFLDEHLTQGISVTMGVGLCDCCWSL